MVEAGKWKAREGEEGQVKGYDNFLIINSCLPHYLLPKLLSVLAGMYSLVLDISENFGRSRSRLGKNTNTSVSKHNRRSRLKKYCRGFSLVLAKKQMSRGLRSRLHACVLAHITFCHHTIAYWWLLRPIVRCCKCMINLFQMLWERTPSLRSVQMAR